MMAVPFIVKKQIDLLSGPFPSRAGVASPLLTSNVIDPNLKKHEHSQKGLDRFRIGFGNTHRQTFIFAKLLF